MKLNDLMGSIYQYGGTIVMAGLFIYVFIQDRIKANKLQEDNNSMLKLLTESNKTLTESNNNSTKIHLGPNRRTYIYAYIHTFIISLVEP